MHRPERAFSRIEVVLVLQELVHEFLRPVMQQVGLFLVEVVQSADGKDGEQEGRFSSFGTKADRMEKGEVMMKEVEVGGEV